MRHFIGICDFTSADEVRAMQDCLASAGGNDLDFRLAVGVMMSYKTLNGLPTKWAGCWPPVEELSDIFSVEGIYNVLHYADYEGIDLARSLKRAADWGGRGLDAVQLDMVWPDRDALKAWRESHPHLDVILQVGATAMARASDEVDEVLKRIRDYGDAIDGVLLDRSMGRGVPMAHEVLMPYVEGVLGMGLAVAVAGGLGPDTVGLVDPIWEKYPQVSIDAQSKLRRSGNAMDPIDWDLAGEYLKRAVDHYKVVTKKSIPSL